MWIVLLVLVVAAASVAFLPMFKGWRTVIVGHATWILGAAVPLLTQVTDHLQGLDWRTYILSWDRRNMYLLAIVGGLGIVSVILRYKTDSRVGEK